MVEMISRPVADRAIAAAEARGERKGLEKAKEEIEAWVLSLADPTWSEIRQLDKRIEALLQDKGGKQDG